MNSPAKFSEQRVCENFEERLSDSGPVWTFISGSLPDSEPVDVRGEFDRLVLSGSLELESVILIEDGLFCLSEMYFRIVSIAEDGSSGIGTKLGIKKDTLLNNN